MVSNYKKHLKIQVKNAIFDLYKTALFL